MMKWMVNDMGGAMKTEAAVTVGTITAGVSAIIALLVAFNVPVTDEQSTAILGIVAVAAPFIVGVITRGHVYSQASVEGMQEVSGGAAVPGA